MAIDQRTADMIELEDLWTRFFELKRRRVRGLAEEYGLSLLQFVTLRHLDEPVAMGQLAETMAFDASYVTAIADGLEEHGLLERRVSPTDRRVKQLVLTDKGRALRRDAMMRMAEIHPLYVYLNDSERRAFADLLGKVVAAEQAERS